jgi:hypothetical protein
MRAYVLAIMPRLLSELMTALLMDLSSALIIATDDYRDASLAIVGRQLALCFNAGV